jgi:hypothetical protein
MLYNTAALALCCGVEQLAVGKDIQLEMAKTLDAKRYVPASWTCDIAA